MVQADYLFLMTDVSCLYTTNPRTDPNAQPIQLVSDVDDLVVDVSSAGSSLGTGGMSTKIVAARLATSAGITTIITLSSEPKNILDIVSYVQALKNAERSSLPPTPSVDGLPSTPVIPIPPLHTRFLPSSNPIRDRSFWLLYGLAPKGTIYIDEGAHRALSSKAGLLPAGVVDVDGDFAQQEAVRIVVIKRLGHLPTMHSRNISTDNSVKMVSSTSSLANFEAGASADDNACAAPADVAETFRRLAPAPVEVGRAVVNYSHKEVARIKGIRSSQIHNVLGYALSEYVALRENISLTKKSSRSGGGGYSSGTVTPSGLIKPQTGNLGSFA